ncbi:hypothetical protein Lalb_Chr01g0008841 [Lupinus albus]|uniref:Uncharacterized protein n=1 Tax=Lupinus albus TaxID=3870 RepID=A0A6A4R4S1_LUPAL|nr:hypothetical protein Lalb_Chr01g0008841 [Lupinus albus]
MTVNNLPFTTPPKTVTLVDEENKTPKKMRTIPVPPTPLTMSVPVPTSPSMNLAMTPAPSSVSFRGDLVQETEYSFEERRLSFVLA